MTIAHHPTDETLLRYAAGRLPAAPKLVIETHLMGCPACRARVQEFEAIGGALLEDSVPVPLAQDALANALAVLDGGRELSPAHRPGKPLPQMPPGFELPTPLRGCEIGPWRWLGIGIRVSKVSVPGDPEAQLSLLRVGAGRKLPDHGHTGTEFTQVIYGSFSDSFGRYRPGDLSEMGDEVEHQPVVDPDGECICLAALEGDMRLRGVIGRLIQPFVRL